MFLLFVWRSTLLWNSLRCWLWLRQRTGSAPSMTPFFVPAGEISKFTVWIHLQWVYTEVTTLALISLSGCTAEELALEHEGGENTPVISACFGPKKRPKMSKNLSRINPSFDLHIAHAVADKTQRAVEISWVFMLLRMVGMENGPFPSY